MKREQIVNSRAYQKTQAALDYYNGHRSDKDIDLTDAFEAGVEWADEHPKEGLVSIDKVCKLLDSNFPSTDYIGSWYKESFIKQFKKSMEE